MTRLHRRSDYHFDLPPSQIAQVPADRRDGARLLVVGDPRLEERSDAMRGGSPAGSAGRAGGNAPRVLDRQFTDLPSLVPADAVVIANDTRVVPARVRAHKASGGAVELLFVEPAGEPGLWRCLARARRPLRAGQVVTVDGDPTAEVEIVHGRAADGSVVVRVPGDVHAFLDAHGELPLPPYIERAAGAADRERYQTMFARDPGAIAAPTAGLHFTPAITAALAARGATLATITLHVGLGTFSPVRDDDLARHVMHVERYQIPEATAALVASGRPVVAIGTTVVRALESAATGPRAVAAGPGETALFIRPGTGFEFRVVDHLVSNFHLPGSTLLMLVSAFAGTERVLAAYRHAVAAGYRFFSYGDATLLTRAPA